MTDAANMIRDYQKQSYELERLRALVSRIRSLAPNGTRGLGSIALDVFDAVEKFDRAPAAQSEPQAAPDDCGGGK